MHLEPELLLLPYNNRWAGKKAGHKAALSAVLLGLALAPLPPAVAITVGLLAGGLACLGAKIRLHTWLELLAAPLLFAASGGVVTALSGAEGQRVALGAVARVFGASSATLLLGATTPLLDVVAILQRRRGFRTISQLFVFSYRAAVAVATAGMAMVNAARLRGLGQSWRSAPVVYGSFAGSLALRSLQNAQRAEAGLAVRGFQLGLPLIGPGERP